MAKESQKQKSLKLYAFSNPKIAYCTFPNEKIKFVLPQSKYYMPRKHWAIWLYCIGEGESQEATGLYIMLHDVFIFNDSYMFFCSFSVSIQVLDT